jgi:hypothetical protein
MSRIYAVPFNGTFTLAGGNADIFSFQPADDKPIKLRGFILSQSSEVGDTGEEGIRITVRRMGATYTVGTGGSSISAAPPIDDASGTNWSFTARANDTAISTTSGANQVLTDICWNVRNTPFDFWYPDVQFAPKARQTEAIVIIAETTPADDISVSWTAFVEEE